MKVVIGDLTIENIVETSTSSHIDVETTLENATLIHNSMKEKGIFTVNFNNEDNKTIGVYMDKIIKKMDYEEGIASFILLDADPLAKQVEQNKADIEYIRLMQDL